MLMSFLVAIVGAATISKFIIKPIYLLTFNTNTISSSNNNSNY